MSPTKLGWLFGASDTQVSPTDDETKTRKVTICGEDCEVTAHKVGKAVWKAYGYAKGAPIHTVGETAPAAFSRWRAIAMKVHAE